MDLFPTNLSRRKLVAAAALAPFILPGRGFAAAALLALVSAQQARRRLEEGNARYAAGRPLRVDHSRRRETVAPAQMPFAIVLGCSDSRVPPEILFDQGLGDIFTIRVAGNIADDHAIGSMEYAVEHFATPLIVVLGHERCGAVAATVDAVAANATGPAHIASIIAAIRPAVVATRGMHGNPLENAIGQNIRRTVAQLRASRPVLEDAVGNNRLTIIGAEYHLRSGRVRFMA